MLEPQSGELLDLEHPGWIGLVARGEGLGIETAAQGVDARASSRNVRRETHLNKASGNLGASGSVAFQFQRMGVFRLSPEGIDQEALELDLIDHDLEEMGESTGEKGEPLLVLRCAFTDFGELQKALEDLKIVPVSAVPEYFAQTPVDLPEDKATEVQDDRRPRARRRRPESVPQPGVKPGGAAGAGDARVAAHVICATRVAIGPSRGGGNPPQGHGSRRARRRHEGQIPPNLLDTSPDARSSRRASVLLAHDPNAADVRHRRRHRR